MQVKWRGGQGTEWSDFQVGGPAQGTGEQESQTPSLAMENARSSIGSPLWPERQQNTNHIRPSSDWGITMVKHCLCASSVRKVLFDKSEEDKCCRMDGVDRDCSTRFSSPNLTYKFPPWPFRLNQPTFPSASSQNCSTCELKRVLSPIT
jgi:hypothetical protein